jgi:hypothetical protein
MKSTSAMPGNDPQRRNEDELPVDKAADPQHEGREQERERLQQELTPPLGKKRKVPEPPQ